MRSGFPDGRRDHWVVGVPYLPDWLGAPRRYDGPRRLSARPATRPQGLGAVL
jgi:hypothetical protein